MHVKCHLIHNLNQILITIKRSVNVLGESINALPLNVSTRCFGSGRRLISLLAILRMECFTSPQILLLIDDKHFSK